MGNETFYCVQCGIRVSGADAGGDRSRCAACLGRPRGSSKRIRKPPSGVVTVVAHPRTTERVCPRTPRILVLGALSFLCAALYALSTFELAQKDEKTGGQFSQPPVPQAVEKTTGLLSQDSPPTEEGLPKPLEELREKVQRPAPPPPDDPAVEALAGEIEEGATALADEGRFEDALARIRTFPEEHRRSRAWTGLEALKRQIEARARTK
jgi:hypothetical protein